MKRYSPDQKFEKYAIPKDRVLGLSRGEQHMLEVQRGEALYSPGGDVFGLCPLLWQPEALPEFPFKKEQNLPAIEDS